MNVSRQLQVADAAIEMAEVAAFLSAMAVCVAILVFFATAAFTIRFITPKRQWAWRGAMFMTSLVIVAVTGVMDVNSQSTLHRAQAQKAAACDAAMAEVVDTGSPEVAKAALRHDCSRDDLLIAAMSSGNGLSAETAKALIRDHGNPQS